MCKYIIEGGRKLHGEIAVEGSKNAVLPILAATVINGGENIIHNCPNLRDVNIMLEVLEELGCKVMRDNDTVIINSSEMKSHEIPTEMAAELRSSIIFLGPVLAKMGKVTISYPGGCEMLLAKCNNEQRFHSLLIIAVKNMK